MALRGFWIQKMTDVLGRSQRLLSTLLISLLIVSFYPAPPTHASSPQSRREKTDQQGDESRANPQFLSALRAYKAQQYATAQMQLESLAKNNPSSFEVNELLGLVFVAEGEQGKANPFLTRAVRIKPNVTEARTRLGTNLLALNRIREAEIEFEKAAALDPQGYDANHNLGEFYIQTGNIANAIPYLKRAQQSDPSAYNNGYDLALAFEQSGKLDEARQQLQQLISLHDSAELRSLLGEIEEKAHNYLSSAKQYEQAARMDPTEQNILNWGAELILHQTFAPAIEVLKAGTQRFPNSPQLQNGLAIAFYGAGQTDDAVQALVRASDLVPSDPLPLTFLGKTCDSASPRLADQIRARLRDFIARDPQNAELHYYLAICLRKTAPTDSTAERDAEVESLLKRTIGLDSKYADAYFQLGTLYADQRKFKEATEQFESALKINPDVANTHYRLAQALSRSGDQSRAQEELATFERLRQKESEATNKQQNQIQQFVYQMRKSDAN